MTPLIGLYLSSVATGGLLAIAIIFIFIFWK